jgi:hypothetical protein
MSKWTNSDGSLNLDALDALEANVRAVTDSNAAIDAVIKGAKIGVPTIVAFRCNHSSLYFPADYVREWGRSYGHGLGPDPVSEVLDSDYHTDPPKVTEDTMDINSIMHPLVTTRVQVDLMNVTQEEFDANQAIIAIDDPRMMKRAAICRAKQMENKMGGRLRSLQANYLVMVGARFGGKVVA